MAAGVGEGRPCVGEQRQVEQRPACPGTHAPLRRPASRLGIGAAGEGDFLAGTRFRRPTAPSTSPARAERASRPARCRVRRGARRPKRPLSRAVHMAVLRACARGRMPKRRVGAGPHLRRRCAAPPLPISWGRGRVPGGAPRLPPLQRRPWPSIMVIFCQILRDRLEPSSSMSLTASITTSSLTDWANSAASLPEIDSISEQ